MTTTDADLALLVERDYLAYVDAYGETPGVEVVHGAGIRLRRSKLDDDYLTSVFGTHVDAAAADAVIAATIEAVGPKRSFHWTVWPTDTPSDLAERLVAAGFDEVGSDPLMAFDLRTIGPPELPPDGFAVREALSAEERAAVADKAVRSVGWVGTGPNPFADTFVRLAAEDPPRMRLFGGFVAGDLVATAELFTGSGVAGIYAVATDEPMRGRGYGRALTLAAMHAGREMGLDTAVLMASELGQPVYRRIGFREVGTVRFFRWPGVTDR